MDPMTESSTQKIAGINEHVAGVDSPNSEVKPNMTSNSDSPALEAGINNEKDISIERIEAVYKYTEFPKATEPD